MPIGRQRIRRVEGNDASFEYEDVSIKRYQNVPELRKGIGDYFRNSNHVRGHRPLEYQTPASAYRTELAESG